MNLESKDTQFEVGCHHIGCESWATLFTFLIVSYKMGIKILISLGCEGLMIYLWHNECFQ